jgi:GTPase involved in cell partitioning and DNA repair
VAAINGEACTDRAANTQIVAGGHGGAGWMNFAGPTNQVSECQEQQVLF